MTARQFYPKYIFTNEEKVGDEKDKFDRDIAEIDSKSYKRN